MLSLQRKTGLKKIGRKGRAWARARRRLKCRFIAMGITSCEARFKGCTGSHYLSFAHARKRRELSPEELSEVALVCMNCHRRLDEQMTHDGMYETVMGIIHDRELNQEVSQIDFIEEYEMTL